MNDESKLKEILQDQELIETVLGKNVALSLRSLSKIYLNPENSTESRLDALQETEEFVEQIDNAITFTKMKLIESLIDILSDFNVNEAALSLLGAVIQNNFLAQETFRPHLKAVVNLIEIRPSKALFVLAGFLKTKQDAEQFDDLGGFTLLRACLSGPYRHKAIAIYRNLRNNKIQVPIDLNEFDE